MGKKIALMYDFFSEHGGVERIMFFQAKMLKKAGHEVSFAFAYVDDSLKEERLKDFEVIEYAKLPVKNETLQISLSILRDEIVKKFQKFDLIICHSFPSSYLALRIKEKYKIPYVLHLHHPPQFLYTADWNWAKNSFKRKFSFTVGKILKVPLRSFDKYCVNNADFYFSESRSVEKMIKEIYHINSTILYPTTDKTFRILNSQLKELKKYGIKKKFILASGRIVRQKRFDYLIDSFSKLSHEEQASNPLVFAGKYDLKEKDYLEALACKKGVNALFLGPLDKQVLAVVYNLAKVTVLTCPKEWFGLVPIEAMSCGCPVVAWKDNWGPQESILEGTSGFLAEPYDTDDLTKKIRIALSKKWNRKKISKSVRRFSEQSQSKILFNSLKPFLR